MAGLSRDRIVAVIGAGTMGAGIAQVAAAAGHSVVLFDSQSGAAERGLKSVQDGLSRLIERKRMAEPDAAVIAAHIRIGKSLDDCKDAALVIEAVIEDLEIKKTLFRALEDVCAADTILASNTSSISITELAGALKHPGRVAGLHFFNPAPVMPLVEVIAGFQTAPSVMDTLLDTATAWNKKPVRVKSTPGFLGNRVARPFYGEALRSLEEGVTDVPTYDTIIREAAGFRMGPFELLDLVGIDVNWAVTNSVHDAYFHDPRYKPFRIQGEMVASGLLGRKTKHGFYDYREGATKPVASMAPRADAPAEVQILGSLGIATPLIERTQKAGLPFKRLHDPRIATTDQSTAADLLGAVVLPHARLALSDGRTATERMAAEGGVPLVLFDLALDYGAAPRLAVTAADQTHKEALADACGFLQAIGIQPSVVDDTPGLIALRTVAMLANFGADAVHAGIADAAGVDLAMQVGFNYPKGPLAWADMLGLPFLVTVLDNIARCYGEDRYRASPLLRRRAAARRKFHG